MNLPPALPFQALSALPRVVLDTHVLLDALLFRNPAVAPLWAQVQQGRLRWLATEPMLQELGRVLGRSFALRWHDQPTGLLAQARPWAELCEPAPCLAHRPSLCSRDPDDQRFIDLAVHARAQGLISRDKALLRLAAGAQAWGVRVLTPEAWCHAAALAPGAGVGRA